MDKIKKHGEEYICLKCKDVIQSKHVHDFVTCSCGSFSVDGGGDYTRVVFNSIDDFQLYEQYLKDNKNDI
jgi:hypothetical protein